MKRIIISIQCFVLLTIYLVSVQSNIISRLKDGYDLVAKFKWNETKVLLDTPFYEKYSLDLLVRKGFTKNGFILQLENFKYDSNNENEKLSESDVKAIELPIFVNLDDTYNIDYVIAFDNDTQKSLDVKDSIMDSLALNWTDEFKLVEVILRNVDSKAVLSHNTTLAFGICETTITFSKSSKEYLVKIQGQAEKCSGEIDKYLAKEIRLDKVSPDSQFKVKYFMDKEELEFRGCTVAVSAKSLDGQKRSEYEYGSKFLEMRAIKHELNESLFTKKYTFTDWMKLLLP